ncbi:RNA polymerase sigma factor [Ornithinibacillus halophilus]|uniref:RNA polymerase sigma factor n=1 Tax=Ornithinibacillus halophilus TaxID=930117 RepID=UPI0009353977|nr:RNA polymerase sigma factor [Ornithinibacillus halophilus]
MEEEYLIDLVKEKDETAFESLVEIYKPIIEKFSFQFGVTPEFIPDVVQETFVKIYQKAHLFNDGNFTSWVYRISLNVAKDHFRKLKRDQKLVAKAKLETTLDNKYRYYFEKQEHVILHECLLELDLKYRAPLILYYFHDKSYDEIASILKMRISTVKTRMHRSKNILKKKFEKYEEQEVSYYG